MCQQCKECENSKEIGFKKGDVIQFVHDSEILTLYLETKNMASFVNKTLNLEQDCIEDLDDLLGRKKSLDERFIVIVEVAKDQAIVDSIVQHCLTGK